MALQDAILRRESSRDFGDTSLSAAELATLLTLGNGAREIVGDRGEPSVKRNAPSAGNLGSCILYPVVMNVDGISPGIYRHEHQSRSLARLREGHFGTWLSHCVLLQRELGSAAVALVLVADFQRLKERYGARGYRLGLLDAGHVSENLYLIATSLRLHVCAVSGFIDDEIDRALYLDGVDHASVLVVVIGR
jgi:SagB-type dehydrogenase family enzyme